jgi:hypothetical protein
MLVGCDVIDKAWAMVDELTETADRLGSIAGNRFADFNQTARDLIAVIEKLSGRVPDDLRRALNDVAARATQAGGIEARCSADFVRDRLAEDIRYVASLFRARALGAEDPARPVREPVVCQPNPPSIRRDRVATIGVIVWDGYDFIDPGASGRKLGAALERGDGSRVPVDVLSVSSNYQVTANVSRLEAQLEADVVRLVLLWGDRVVSEVTVEKLPPQPHQTVLVSLDPWGPFTANRPEQPMNPKGDREFRGHGPFVTWSVGLSVTIDERQLVATVRYHAIEWDGGRARPREDYTEAAGEWNQIVYSAPTGQRILRIVDSAEDSGSYVDVDPNADAANGGLYPQYILGGDGYGDDVGVHTTIAAPFRGKVQIEVESSP